MLLGAKPDPHITEAVGTWSQHWIDFVNNGEEAKLGDVWVVRQPPDEPNRRTFAGSRRWPIIGFALTCPKQSCEFGMHVWDHAHECKAGHTVNGIIQLCQKGPNRGCWDWTGSPNNDTLTGSPSLHCVESFGGCGWHGWLRNGVMVGA